MKILVAGDFCPLGRVADYLESGRYNEILGEVRPVIEAQDYSIVNFECPVVERDATAIAKDGPQLKCSKRGVDAIKWAGFRCVTLANNHFYDYGEQGVADTLLALKERGIDRVGGGRNLAEASSILYKEIKGKTLAVISCCEHEFSLASDDKGGSNPLNPIRQHYAIQEARSRADYVLVIVHGGHEFYQFPSMRMQETYRFFIDSGADAVINHHQHCFSGYEVYKDKPIFYGIGNFCFDYDKPIYDTWYLGYMVGLSLGSDIAYDIIPYVQCKESPGVFMSTIDKVSFTEDIIDINNIIRDSRLLFEKQQTYYASCTSNIRSIFSQPYSRRLWRKLYSKGLLPRVYSNLSHPQIRNLVQCEAHRDKLQYFLENDF